MLALVLISAAAGQRLDPFCLHFFTSPQTKVDFYAWKPPDGPRGRLTAHVCAVLWRRFCSEPAVLGRVQLVCPPKLNLFGEVRDARSHARARIPTHQLVGPFGRDVTALAAVVTAVKRHTNYMVKSIGTHTY